MVTHREPRAHRAHRTVTPRAIPSKATHNKAVSSKVSPSRATPNKAASSKASPSKAMSTSKATPRHRVAKAKATSRATPRVALSKVAPRVHRTRVDKTRAATLHRHLQPVRLSQHYHLPYAHVARSPNSTRASLLLEVNAPQADATSRSVTNLGTQRMEKHALSMVQQARVFLGRALGRMLCW